MRSRARAIARGPASSGRRCGIRAAVSMTLSRAVFVSPHTNTSQRSSVPSSASACAGMVLKAHTRATPSGTCRAIQFRVRARFLLDEDGPPCREVDRYGHVDHDLTRSEIGAAGFQGLDRARVRNGEKDEVAPRQHFSVAAALDRLCAEASSCSRRQRGGRAPPSGTPTRPGPPPRRNAAPGPCLLPRSHPENRFPSRLPPATDKGSSSCRPDDDSTTRMTARQECNPSQFLEAFEKPLRSVFTR